MLMSQKGFTGCLFYVYKQIQCTKAMLKIRGFSEVSTLGAYGNQSNPSVMKPSLDHRLLRLLWRSIFSRRRSEN